VTFDPLEHDIQSKLVDKLGPLMRPELVRMAIPNGGLRHPIVGKMLKAEGLLPGSPDLVFALEQGLTYWLEMKKLKGRLRDEQVGIHYKLRQLGHTVDTAYSYDEAMDLLNQRGILR
jgi:hypothetical protein